MAVNLQKRIRFYRGKIRNFLNKVNIKKQNFKKKLEISRIKSLLKKAKFCDFFIINNVGLIKMNSKMYSQIFIFLTKIF